MAPQPKLLASFGCKVDHRFVNRPPTTQKLVVMRAGGESMAEPKISLPAYGQIAYFWNSKVYRLHTFRCAITPLFGVRSPPFPIYIL